MQMLLLFLKQLHMQEIFIEGHVGFFVHSFHGRQHKVLAAIAAVALVISFDRAFVFAPLIND